MHSMLKQAHLEQLATGEVIGRIGAATAVVEGCVENEAHPPFIKGPIGSWRRLIELIIYSTGDCSGVRGVVSLKCTL